MDVHSCQRCRPKFSNQGFPRRPSAWTGGGAAPLMKQLLYFGDTEWIQRRLISSLSAKAGTKEGIAVSGLKAELPRTRQRTHRRRQMPTHRLAGTPPFSHTPLHHNPPAQGFFSVDDMSCYHWLPTAVTRRGENTAFDQHIIRDRGSTPLNGFRRPSRHVGPRPGRYAGQTANVEQCHSIPSKSQDEHRPLGRQDEGKFRNCFVPVLMRSDAELSKRPLQVSSPFCIILDRKRRVRQCKAAKEPTGSSHFHGRARLSVTSGGPLQLNSHSPGTPHRSSAQLCSSPSQHIQRD